MKYCEFGQQPQSAIHLIFALGPLYIGWMYCSSGKEIFNFDFDSMYTGSFQNASFGSGDNSVWSSEIQASEMCVTKGVGPVWDTQWDTLRINYDDFLPGRKKEVNNNVCNCFYTVLNICFLTIALSYKDPISNKYKTSAW